MNEKELSLIQNGKLNRWTIENSKELYGIPNWGKGFFTISDKGEVVATPIRGQEHQIYQPYGYHFGDKRARS